jgi:hypothetical protein
VCVCVCVCARARVCVCSLWCVCDKLAARRCMGACERCVLTFTQLHYGCVRMRTNFHSTDKVYGCVLNRADIAKRKNGFYKLQARME